MPDKVSGPLKVVPAPSSAEAPSRSGRNVDSAPRQLSSRTCSASVSDEDLTKTDTAQVTSTLG
jgi:hypothetical protein